MDVQGTAFALMFCDWACWYVKVYIMRGCIMVSWMCVSASTRTIVSLVQPVVRTLALCFT